MSMNNPEGKREHPKTYGPTRTDQAAGPATRIGYMIRRFKDTGEMWPVAQQVLNYGDISEVPDLHEMMTRSANAISAFNELPVEIRHKCKHDASNFEAFLSDPENAEMCENYGLVEPEEVIEVLEPVVETPPEPEVE